MLAYIFFIFFLFFFTKKWQKAVNISYPVFFAIFGLALGILYPFIPNEGVDLVVQIVILIHFLFESMRIKFSSLLHFHSFAMRLSTIGFIISFSFIFYLIYLFFPQIEIRSNILIAILLSSTDGHILSSFFTETSIPSRIRQTLSLESSVTALIALFASVSLFLPFSGLFEEMFAPLFLSGIFGVFLGFSFRYLNRRVAFPILVSLILFGYFLVSSFFFCLFLSTGVGLILGNGFRLQTAGLYTRGIHYFFALAYFILIAKGLQTSINVKIMVFSFLVLFFVRPFAVFIALQKSGLRFPTICILGWLGPKGLTALSLGWILIGLKSEFSLIFYPCLFSIFIHGIMASSPFLTIWKKYLIGEEETLPTVELPY